MEKAGDGREEDSGGRKRKDEEKDERKQLYRLDPACIGTSPGTCRSRSPCLSHLYVLHGDSTLTTLLTNFRELKTKREREKKKEMAFRMQTAGREQLRKRRVVMELILGRILLRSSNMKHNETSKHFASVYGRSFHSRCKNICEFL